MGQCFSSPDSKLLKKSTSPRKKRRINKALIGLPRDFQHLAHGGADGMVMTPVTPESQLSSLKNKMEGFAKILDGMEINPHSSEIVSKVLPSSSSNNYNESSLPEGDKSLIKASSIQNFGSGTLDDVLRFNDTTGRSVSQTASSIGINGICEGSPSLLPTDGTTLYQQKAQEELEDGGAVTLSESVTSREVSHFSKLSLPSLPLPLIEDITSQDNSMGLPKLSPLDSSPALLESITDINFLVTRQTTVSRAGSI